MHLVPTPSHSTVPNSIVAAKTTMVIAMLLEVVVVGIVVEADAAVKADAMVRTARVSG